MAEQAGRTDFREAGEVAALRQAVERAFAAFESHAAHETAFVTPVLPALNAPERAELLAGIRAVAPPGAFEAMADIARRVLPPAEWSRLEMAVAAAA